MEVSMRVVYDISLKVDERTFVQHVALQIVNIFVKLGLIKESSYISTTIKL